MSAQRTTRRSLALVAVALCMPLQLQAQATDDSAHLDERRLTDGCRSCHSGHGVANTPMLNATRGEACLQCHGGLTAAARKRVELGASGRLANIRGEFAKPYRHPLETAPLHRSGETLPEVNPASPRHVDCLDCHDAHRPQAGSSSLNFTRPRGSSLAEVRFEHELCLRCHGDSANLPSEQRNIRRLIAPTARSFHPIAEAGRGDDVPSLRNPFSRHSVIGCTDCHGGDPSAVGRGPHGSVYAGLLVENYATRDAVPESEMAYKLCYRCHDRQSIVRGESFTGHTSHLADPGKRTACFTCHNSHGSTQNLHLIEFNPAVVMATSKGALKYASSGRRSGECYLSCHGAEHNPGRYCPPGEACDPGVVRGVKAMSPAGVQKSLLMNQQPAMNFDDPFGAGK